MSESYPTRNLVLECFNKMKLFHLCCLAALEFLFCYHWMPSAFHLDVFQYHLCEVACFGCLFWLPRTPVSGQLLFSVLHSNHYDNIIVYFISFMNATAKSNCVLSSFFLWPGNSRMLMMHVWNLLEIQWQLHHNYVTYLSITPRKIEEDLLNSC